MKHGKIFACDISVGARPSILDSCDKDYEPSDGDDDDDSPVPRRKIIKPVADFQVTIVFALYFDITGK